MFRFWPIADCLKLPTVPTGTWYCKNCQNLFEKEKFVERNANAVAAGRVPGIDSIEQITNRRIHIINTEEVDFGGCVLCRCPPVLAFDEEKNICCAACKAKILARLPLNVFLGVVHVFSALKLNATVNHTTLDMFLGDELGFVLIWLCGFVFY